jgi:uncharacterized protein
VLGKQRVKVFVRDCAVVIRNKDFTHIRPDGSYLRSLSSITGAQNRASSIIAYWAIIQTERISEYNWQNLRDRSFGPPLYYVCSDGQSWGLVRVFKISVTIAIALYLLLLAIFFFAQRSFLYFPSHLYVPLSEARANPAFQEFSVRTSDGIDLKGWYAPATTRQCTIVFFHGNGDSLRAAAPIANPYIAAGYGFLVTTYRGYSGMPGRPTEVGLYNDGRAFIQGLIGKGVASRNIILFGHSLGAGVAVQMAVEFQVRGVMLLAPFLSIPKLARIHFPFIPSFLALDRFDNERKISKIDSPLLIANGDRDQVVPPSHGARLYTLANQPKEFHSFPGRGHNDAFDQFAPMSIDWLARACSPN